MDFMTNQSIDELREKLADIEHQRWADWQAWCHKILRENCPSPELEAVLERWDKQIETPYSALTDKEKASDMEQVDRYWPLINSYIATEVIRELEMLDTRRHYGMDYQESLDELDEYVQVRINHWNKIANKEEE